MPNERIPVRPPKEPRKEPIDRKRQEDAEHTEVRERGPDTGGGKLRPGDR